MYLVQDEHGNLHDVLSGRMDNYHMSPLEAFEDFISENDPRYTLDAYRLIKADIITLTGFITADNVEAFLDGE